MKKIFIMFILLVLTACPGHVFPVVIKNMYYDEVYIYSPIYNKYLAKGDIFEGFYSTNLSSQERNKYMYFVYKDKNKKELVTSFSQEDLKIGTGWHILGFDEKGVFEIEDSDKSEIHKHKND